MGKKKNNNIIDAYDILHGKDGDMYHDGDFENIEYSDLWENLEAEYRLSEDFKYAIDNEDYGYGARYLKNTGAIGGDTGDIKDVLYQWAEWKGYTSHVGWGYGHVGWGYGQEDDGIEKAFGRTTPVGYNRGGDIEKIIKLCGGGDGDDLHDDIIADLISQAIMNDEIPEDFNLDKYDVNKEGDVEELYAMYPWLDSLTKEITEAAMADQGRVGKLSGGDFDDWRYANSKDFYGVDDSGIAEELSREFGGDFSFKRSDNNGFSLWSSADGKKYFTMGFDEIENIIGRNVDLALRGESDDDNFFYYDDVEDCIFDRAEGFCNPDFDKIYDKLMGLGGVWDKDATKEEVIDSYCRKGDGSVRIGEIITDLEFSNLADADEYINIDKEGLRYSVIRDPECVFKFMENSPLGKGRPVELSTVMAWPANHVKSNKDGGSMKKAFGRTRGFSDDEEIKTIADIIIEHSGDYGDYYSGRGRNDGEKDMPKDQQQSLYRSILTDLIQQAMMEEEIPDWFNAGEVEKYYNGKDVEHDYKYDDSGEEVELPSGSNEEWLEQFLYEIDVAANADMKRAINLYRDNPEQFDEWFDMGTEFEGQPGGRRGIENQEKEVQHLEKIAQYWDDNSYDREKLLGIKKFFEGHKEYSKWYPSGKMGKPNREEQAGYIEALKKLTWADLDDELRERVIENYDNRWKSLGTNKNRNNKKSIINKRKKGNGMRKNNIRKALPEEFEGMDEVFDKLDDMVRQGTDHANFGESNSEDNGLFVAWREIEDGDRNYGDGSNDMEYLQLSLNSRVFQQSDDVDDNSVRVATWYEIQDMNSGEDYTSDGSYEILQMKEGDSAEFFAQEIYDELKRQFNVEYKFGIETLNEWVEQMPGVKKSIKNKGINKNRIHKGDMRWGSGDSMDDNAERANMWWGEASVEDKIKVAEWAYGNGYIAGGSWVERFAQKQEVDDTISNGIVLLYLKANKSNTNKKKGINMRSNIRKSEDGKFSEGDAVEVEVEDGNWVKAIIASDEVKNGKMKVDYDEEIEDEHGDVYGSAWYGLDYIRRAKTNKSNRFNVRKGNSLNPKDWFESGPNEVSKYNGDNLVSVWREDGKWRWSEVDDNGTIDEDEWFDTKEEAMQDWEDNWGGDIRGRKMNQHEKSNRSNSRKSKGVKKSYKSNIRKSEVSDAIAEAEDDYKGSHKFDSVAACYFYDMMGGGTTEIAPDGTVYEIFDVEQEEADSDVLELTADAGEKVAVYETDDGFVYIIDPWDEAEYEKWLKESRAEAEKVVEEALKSLGWGDDAEGEVDNAIQYLYDHEYYDDNIVAVGADEVAEEIGKEFVPEGNDEEEEGDEIEEKSNRSNIRKGGTDPRNTFPGKSGNEPLR